MTYQTSQAVSSLGGFFTLEGQSTLPFTLFRLAPPHVALQMMREKLITNLDEENDEGLNLLYFHGNGHRSSATPIPTWSDWERFGDHVWQGWAQEQGLDVPKASHQVVLASMIFAGADPWRSWAKEGRKVHSFLEQTVLAINGPMLRLLLSHPKCPSVDLFEETVLRDVDLKGESWNSSSKIKEAPLMHFLVNSSAKDMVEALIEKGMDVNKLDEKGRTPLFYVRDVEIANLLIEKGANLAVKDNDGKTIGVFWRSHFSTVATQSEFNKILIAKMSKTLSKDDLQEMQKPALFNEVNKGTKGNFEAIYRKAKFAPTVTFDQGAKGVWSLRTAALLRNSDVERAKMFLTWADTKELGWEHEVWPGTGVTDASLALLRHDLRSTSSSAAISSKLGAPSAPFSAMVDEMWSAWRALARSGMSTTSCFDYSAALLSMPAQADADKSGGSSYELRHCYQKFYTTAGIFFPNTPQTQVRAEALKITPDRMNILSLIWERATMIGIKQTKKESAQHQYGYTRSINANTCTVLGQEFLGKPDLKKVDGYKTALLFLFGASIAAEARDASPYNANNQTAMGKLRTDILTEVHSWPDGEFPLTDKQYGVLSMLLKEVSKDSPVCTQIEAALSSRHMLSQIDTSGTASSQKRRM